MKQQESIKLAKLPALEEALDRESYEWLEINYPSLLAALEKDITRGVKPDEVYRGVLAYCGRDEIAQRLRQAARNMQRAA